MSPDTTERRILADASARVGLDPEGAEVIRLGENAIYRLPGRVVARIARPGRLDVAAREVAVSRWLARQHVDAVRAIDGVEQPVDVDGRAVTFWEEVPRHRHGTPVEVAGVLRRLHDLQIPDEIGLPMLDPFAALPERIDGAATLTAADRDWLRLHLDRMRGSYRDLAGGLPQRVIHGDAWVGNVVMTDDRRTVLLDLERCSIGPPEWDLVSTAIKHTSFGWVSGPDYRAFCDRYGHDVTAWAGFAVLRDLRELRMTCYLAQHAAEQPTARIEAALRVACLQNSCGPRPWSWTAAA